MVFEGGGTFVRREYVEGLADRAFTVEVASSCQRRLASHLVDN